MTEPLVARIHFPAYDGLPSRYPVDAAATSEGGVVVAFSGALLARALRDGPAVLTVDAAGFLASETPGVVEAVRATFHARYRLRLIYSPDGPAAELAREIAAALGGTLELLDTGDDAPEPDGDVTY